jgi:hypothetical protein
MIGFFNDPDDLIYAAAQAKAEGYKGRGFDAYSPYPLHGIEEAMGIGRSWIPAVALFMLFTGASLGFLLQYWTHVLEYPMNVGGFANNAWPAYIVIVFESAVLLAGVTTFLCIFLSCKLLPNPFTKTLDDDMTNDRFALILPARGEEKLNEAAKLLQRMGADEIRTIDR